MNRTPFGACIAMMFAIPIVNIIAIAEEPERTVQSFLADARDAQARRDFTAAAASYRKAIELDPAVSELWANLGLMYYESGKSAEAIRSFKEAVRLNSSLFVPQLFLGIAYLGSNTPGAALPFLLNAERLHPNDLQAATSLGKAYAALDEGDRAADFFRKATRLAPQDGDAWLGLGTAYLQQVESDARLMMTTYSHSAYGNLRAAEAFAEEGKLIQAEDAYESAISSASTAPCAHAEFGITLLREKKLSEAREQFKLETQSGSHCGFARLGDAVADLVEGHPDAALGGLTSIAMADAGFIRLSLPLFRGAVSADQARSLAEFARTRQNDAARSIDISSLIERAFLSDDLPDASVAVGSDEEGLPSSPQTSANAERLYARGQYKLCKEVLEPVLQSADLDRLQLLASCSFYGGDFRTTSMTAERLKATNVTRAEGLYWESKADQKLATTSLIRAGRIDANSPRMHALLGDVFRAKRMWDDAETEYKKAVALDPKSRSARLGLAITLFSELKTDEAFLLDKSLLAEDTSDPEANLLAGEILIQRNQFPDAEIYLRECADLKPELEPRYHALLGRVFAETGRIPEAIAEYKLGLSTDEDGSIHYQLARLYQKSGNKAAAEEAFKQSKRLADRRNSRAGAAVEQSLTDVSRQ